MTLDTKPSMRKADYFEEQAEARYMFSFFHARPEGERVTEVAISPEADNVLRRLDLPLETRYMGSACFYRAKSGKTLYFEEFMPFWSLERSQHPRHGVAIALFLAVAEKFTKMHPRAMVKFSPHLTSDARSFYDKLSINAQRPISIQDLYAKIKRYHSSPKLREIMGRKVRRETLRNEHFD